MSLIRAISCKGQLSTSFNGLSMMAPCRRWLECRSSPRQTTNPDFLLPRRLVPFFAIVFFVFSSSSKSKNFEHGHVRRFSRRRQRLMNWTDPVLEWTGSKFGIGWCVSSALPGNCDRYKSAVHFANGRRTNDTVYGSFWDWRSWTVRIRFRNDFGWLCLVGAKERVRRENWIAALGTVDDDYFWQLVVFCLDWEKSLTLYRIFKMKSTALANGLGLQFGT